MQATMLPVAGLLSQFPRDAASLEAFLSSVFTVPIQVQQCVQRMAPIPKGQQCLLGHGFALGESALLGQCIEDMGGKISLHIGPLHAEDFLYFQPGHEGQDYLQQLVHFFCTEPLEFDVHLYLAEDQAPDCILGHSAEGPPMTALGCMAWLGDTQLHPMPTHNPHAPRHFSGHAAFSSTSAAPKKGDSL